VIDTGAETESRGREAGDQQPEDEGNEGVLEKCTLFAVSVVVHSVKT